jgi:twitching motility protein PilT
MPAIKRRESQLRLGEILVHHGVVTPEVLNQALRRQAQIGGHLAAILNDMGSVTLDVILACLSKQYGVPAVDLFSLDIPRNVVDLLPLEHIRRYKAIPLAYGEKVTLGMVNPADAEGVQKLEFVLGRPAQPVIVASLQMDAAIRVLTQEGRDLKGDYVRAAYQAVLGNGIAELGLLLRRLSESDASDLQLTAGAPPSLRMGNELHRLKLPPLTPTQVHAYARDLMTEAQQKRFELQNDIDFSFTDRDAGRFRVNIYRQRNSVSITMRRIWDRIPNLKELGLTSDIEEYALNTKGLILITGPAGHGKSTTLASLVDAINTRRRCNVVSLEDPIEFLHAHKNSNINQREIGTDTASFPDGLRHIFRQSPDVIVVGEMRDADSFRIGLQAAETGHLVLSTMHSRNATSALERIITTFPAEEQAQVRNQLADLQFLIISQRLLPEKNGMGLVLAYERLLSTNKVRKFIRENKTDQIRTQLQLQAEEYRSIDVALAGLCIGDRIDFEDGARHADNLSFYRDRVRNRVHREDVMRSPVHIDEGIGA